MGALTNALVSILEKFPEAIIWRFARRYIAGSQISDGIQVLKQLDNRKILSTMDVLGEDTFKEADADEAVTQYLNLIEEISKTGISANISIKPTQMGLNLDKVKAGQRIEKLARAANDKGFLLRLDIEDSSTTDNTYEIYNRLRTGFPRTGAAIQAYLKRSCDDIRKLSESGPIDIRICKGIYKEPEQIAYKNKQQIRSNFMELIRMVWDRDGYPAIATHDKWVITESIREIKKRGLSSEKYEFQMLYGVGQSMWSSLREAGHTVRIYVPFGVAWRAYSFRRFRENPVMAYYVIKNIVTPR
ncbi:proline dehydrogenase family protein [bacterium]|nr:proline dehydrogenase family protein [candidate division CSSED10-310 bacterium]